MKTRRTRTSYMKNLQKDEDASLLCSAWIHGPNSRKEEKGHIILGKSIIKSGDNHGYLEISGYDLKEDLLSEPVSGFIPIIHLLCLMFVENLPYMVEICLIFLKHFLVWLRLFYKLDCCRS